MQTGTHCADALQTSPERIAALHTIRDRLIGNDGQRQRERALEALQTLGHLTTFEGSRYLDLYDPRARVMELRKAGHPIVTTWRKVPTESGRLHRIGVYVMARPAPEVRV